MNSRTEEVVLYEERGSVAIVTLNRPDRMNTLTEGVVQGVADSIDRATASRPVRCATVAREVVASKEVRPSAATTLDESLHGSCVEGG